MKSKYNSVRVFRFVSLGFFLIIVTWASIWHMIKGPGPATIDTLCPFGGIETLYKYIAGGGFIQRIQLSNIVLLFGTVTIGVLLGRAFCGWICALGALQGIFGKVGRLLFKKNFTIPVFLDRPLRYLKYIILAVILYYTWKIGALIIRPFDPWAAYGHLTAGWHELWNEFGIGFIILVTTLLLSIFYERVFCKYLCPLGAFLGFMNKIPFFRIKRVNSTCTHCKLCDRKCMMNIEVEKQDSIKSAECINCQECVIVCPTGKLTLKSTLFGSILSSALVGILAVGIYLAVIGVSHLAGWWKPAPATLQQISQKTGMVDPEEIKGAYNLMDISKAFDIPLEELYKKLELSVDKIPFETRLKDISPLIGKPFEVDTVREIVRQILQEKGVTQPEGAQKDKITDTTIQANNNQLVVPGDFNLEGTMTISEVAKALNTTELVILKKLGLPSNLPLDKPLRDLKSQYGFSMPELKNKIHE